ncbi:hypothetical protein H8356DRAFT_1329796 [Neocallimastix lanati (nom. inval.)]|nr:hypothetical protein H8356DRAFT_1329796 [Neocallimastix sp. JGI-2020a]
MYYGELKHYNYYNNMKPHYRIDYLYTLWTMGLYGLGYIGLVSKRNYKLETRRNSTNKILNNNMHTRAPLLKRSVRPSSWDNSAFIKRKAETKDDTRNK